MSCILRHCFNDNREALFRVPLSLLFKKKKKINSERVYANLWCGLQGNICATSQDEYYQILMSLAINLDWKQHENTFLQGNLDEEIYMTMPPGDESS